MNAQLLAKPYYDKSSLMRLPIWPQKSHGFWIFAVNREDSVANFENTVDHRGSAVIFDADSGLCLSYVRILCPKRNLCQRSLFSLSRYVNEFIQIISFFERSSFKLRFETVIGIVSCYSHQACCLLYVWAKLTVAFTFTSLPLKLNTSLFRLWLWFRI